MTKFMILGLITSALFTISYASECAYYTVKQGDSYERISKKFGVSVKDLMEANKGKKVLKVGEQICIPAGANVSGSKQIAKADTKDYEIYVVQKSGSRLEHVAKRLGIDVKTLENINPELKGKTLSKGTKVKYPKTETAVQEKPREEVKYITHKVKRGETLDSIAKKYGVSVEEIKKANNMKNSRIATGKTLKIPVQITGGKETDRKQIAKADTKDYEVYVVQKSGSRLEHVAKRLGIDVKTLENINPELKGKTLSKGTKVKYPKTETAVREKPREEVKYITHKVKRGETLDSIAKKYGVSVEEIKKANNMKNSRIATGKTLKIPTKEVVVTKVEEQDTPSKRREEIASLPVENNRNTSFRLERNSLSMPVEGKIVQSPRGVDIITDCGKDIRSVEDGRVIYSGNDLSAYGNMIIVEHSNFISLYAFNSENLVKRGDRVTKGQVIAKVGGKVPQEQCMLRFELRSNDGTPLDPTEFLATK